MQLDFQFWVKEKTPVLPVVELESRRVPLVYDRNDRAKRYLLYLRADGTARVTIPRRGSEKQAREFVEQHKAWLERAFMKLEAKIIPPQYWTIGAEFLFHGQPVMLQGGPDDRSVGFAGEIVTVKTTETNLRPFVEAHLFSLARGELPGRVFALAGIHQCVVRKVAVRNQSSRWGSCSIRGTISLNWRLIQTPSAVRDYIILHELMHTKEMNHSSRFWSLVAQVCPDYEESEQWLRVNGPRLGL